MERTEEEVLFEILRERIKRYRTDRKMSQAQLATKVQVDRTTIVHIESGRHRPALYLLWRIAQAFDMPFIELLPQEKEVSRQMYPNVPHGISSKIEASANGDDLTVAMLSRFVHDHAKDEKEEDSQ